MKGVKRYMNDLGVEIGTYWHKSEQATRNDEGCKGNPGKSRVFSLP